MSNGSLMNKGRLNLLQEKSPRKKESSFPNAMSTIRRCQPAMSLTSLHRRFCPTTTFWSDETVKTLWLDWCENWILLLKGQIAPLFVVDSSNVFKVQSNIYPKCGTCGCWQECEVSLVANQRSDEDIMRHDALLCTASDEGLRRSFHTIIFILIFSHYKDTMLNWCPNKVISRCTACWKCKISRLKPTKKMIAPCSCAQTTRLLSHTPAAKHSQLGLVLNFPLGGTDNQKKAPVR